MEKVIRFDENLDMFKNLVLLYKNEKGDTFLGSSINSNDNQKDNKNYIVLYKESLPKDKDYIMGWNQLDDSSEKIYLVYNQHSEVAVDDFLAAHGVDKTWKDIDYVVLDSMNDINNRLMSDKLSNNEVRAYCTAR